MSSDQWVLVFYGCFLLVGAFMGYRAGSQISLITGLICAILIFAGVFFIHQPRNTFLYMTVLNGLLAMVFLMRFLKTRHFMPSGMLLTVTAAVFIFCLFRLLKTP